MGDNIKILVIGDTCKDVYIYGDCERLCPDAPVPVFLPKYEIITSGMSGNVVNNLISLGINPDIITNEKQVTKIRYVDDKTNQMIIRIDEGENDIKRISNISEIDLNIYDGIIISDYDKGFLFEEDIKYICNNHDMVFIDTKKHINNYCKNATYIKINNLEYKLSKYNIDNMDIYNSLIITLGSKGAKYKNKIYPVEMVDIKDQTGAGDTFICALMSEFLKTKDIDMSIEFANKCSSWVVTQRGVTIVNRNKI